MSALESMQATLAAEHAALWSYGVLAAQAAVPATDPERARLATELAEGFTVHRDRRDRLEAWIRGREAVPEPAAAGYTLADDLDTTAGLRAAALDIERACCTVYADLVANTEAAERQWAVDALGDAAIRQLSYAGSAESFPGLGELGGR